MPTKREEIEKWSSAYAFLKYYVDFCFNFYFRTSIAGMENIPRKGTLIFTPNHQNALMDALGVLSVKKWQPIFLARADIFEKPLVNKILTFLKIMPVYRFRDGYQNLSKNDAVFNKTMDVLKNENGLVILPEGNHGDKKQLRKPLKKGFARIAFQAEEECNGDLDIKIVPVGMDYTHYSNVGSKLHIRFGTPINVRPLLPEYRNNPAKGYNQLIELLESGLKKEMIHIEDEKYYKSYLLILDSFTETYLARQKLHNTHENMLDAQRFIISKIDDLRKNDFDSYLVLMAKSLEYEMVTKKAKLNPATFPTKASTYVNTFAKLLLLIISSPIFIYSFFNNAIPLLIPFFATKKIKDTQFHSSIRFVLGLLGFPIFHIIQTIVFGIVTGSLSLTIAYALSLPLGVYVFFWWREEIFACQSQLREILLNITDSKQVNKAKEVRQALISKLWDLVQSKSEEDYLPNYLSE